MGREGVYFILAPYKRRICYQNIVAGFLEIFVTFVDDLIDNVIAIVLGPENGEKVSPPD